MKLFNYTIAIAGIFALGVSAGVHGMEDSSDQKKNMVGTICLDNLENLAREQKYPELKVAINNLLKEEHHSNVGLDQVRSIAFTCGDCLCLYKTLENQAHKLYGGATFTSDESKYTLTLLVVFLTRVALDAITYQVVFGSVDKMLTAYEMWKKQAIGLFSAYFAQLNNIDYKKVINSAEGFYSVRESREFFDYLWVAHCGWKRYFVGGGIEFSPVDSELLQSARVKTNKILKQQVRPFALAYIFESLRKHASWSDFLKSTQDLCKKDLLQIKNELQKDREISLSNSINVTQHFDTREEQQNSSEVINNVIKLSGIGVEGIVGLTELVQGMTIDGDHDENREFDSQREVTENTVQQQTQVEQNVLAAEVQPQNEAKEEGNENLGKNDQDNSKKNQ